MGGDRLGAEEQQVSDLTVGATLGDQLGDATLGRGQRPRAWRAAADPGELGGGPGRPQPRTKPVEQRQRLLERLAGGPLLPAAAPHHPERQQGTGPLERPAEPVVRNQRALQLRQCTIEVTTGGLDQPAGPGGGGQRERPVQRTTPRLQVLGQRGRLVQLAQLHQRIQLGPDQARPGRLADTHVAEALQQRAELGVGCLGVALGKGQKAQHRAPLQHQGHETAALGRLEELHRGRPLGQRQHAQPPAQVSADPAGRRSLQRRGQVRTAAADLPSGHPVVAGGNPAAANLLDPVRWGQPHGGLGQLRRDLRRPARPSPVSALLHRGRHRRIRAVGRQHQMPGAFLRIGQRRRQPGMQRAPRRRCQPRPRGDAEQRMREPQPALLDPQHVGVQRGVEGGLGVLAEHGHDQPHARGGKPRHHGKRLGRLGR
jgi:hypothetical protein